MKLRSQILRNVESPFVGDRVACQDGQIHIARGAGGAVDLRPELIDRDHVRNVLVQKLYDHASVHLTKLRTNLGAIPSQEAQDFYDGSIRDRWGKVAPLTAYLSPVGGEGKEFQELIVHRNASFTSPTLHM